MFFFDSPSGEVKPLVEEFLKTHPIEYLVNDEWGMEWEELEPLFSETFIEKLQREFRERLEFMENLTASCRVKKFAEIFPDLQDDLKFLLDHNLIHGAVLQIKEGTVVKKDGRKFKRVITKWEKLLGIIKYTRLRAELEKYVNERLAASKETQS